MTDPYETSPTDVLRWDVNRAVLAYLRKVHGPDAVIVAPISPELSSTHERPAEFGQGIAAARIAAGAGRRLMLEFVDKARGEGVPWSKLAEPLGIDGRDTDDPAAAAFELIAEGNGSFGGYGPAIWRCASCQEFVKDHGPQGGHPDDCETGHAPTCERHALAVATYESEMN